MKHKIIVANWKMNPCKESIISHWFNSICNKNMNTYNQASVSPPASSLTQTFSVAITNLIVALPLLAIGYVRSIYQNIALCVQDISKIDGYGPYTGECSAKMAKDLGVDYAIIGHSERRTYFHETKQEISQKVRNAINNDIIPVVCIGEKEKFKNHKEMKNFLKNEIANVIFDTEKQQILAYEPMWAIGSGITPTLEEINEIILTIKSILSSLLKNSSNIKIIYGGSVDLKNYGYIMKQSYVDGVLVGSASLLAENVVSMLSYL